MKKQLLNKAVSKLNIATNMRGEEQLDLISSAIVDLQDYRTTLRENLPDWEQINESRLAIEDSLIELEEDISERNKASILDDCDTIKTATEYIIAEINRTL